jgi:hypothetical protein
MSVTVVKGKVSKSKANKAFYTVLMNMAVMILAVHG